MKIKIVDNSDNEIGVKQRSEIDYKNDIYRVSALWITNSIGLTLLAKRALIKEKDPGKWGPAVAGTVDEGESYDENIYKEAMEEIGLENEKFTKGPKVHITYPRNYFCQWYFVQFDRDIESFTMQKEEVDELMWIDVAQMKDEIKSNPDKYVPAMPQVVRELGL
jgi:isopentenyldiphosphate isomerase